MKQKMKLLKLGIYGRETMKVIFLDIDGVLNHAGCTEKIDGCYFVEEPLIMNLVNLMDATGAKVVLSSTWRLGWLEMDSGLDTKEVRHFKALKEKSFGISSRFSKLSTSYSLISKQRVFNGNIS